jgi:hypothetical protein
MILLWMGSSYSAVAALYFCYLECGGLKVFKLASFRKDSLRFFGQAGIRPRA